MTDPPRLLDLESDELTRSLLEFGSREVPARGVRRRIHAAATMAAAAATVTPLAAAPLAGKTLFSSIVTWAGVGMVAGSVTSGAVLFVTERAPSRGAVAENRETPVVVGRTKAPSFEPVAAAVTTPTAAPPSSAVAKQQPSIRASRSASSELARPADALQQELVLLDRARQALRRGDAKEAMAALDAHGERGVLNPEARVLRIEALLARGDRAAATRLAERFLAEDSRSPHASRVRALLSQTK